MPMQVEKMRAFIIKFLYYCIILGLVYVAFKYAVPVLMPFLVAFLIAFLLKPVINRIADRTGKKRRTVAIFSLIVFYVLLVTLLIVLGTRLVVLLRDAFYALPSVYESVISPALVSLQRIIEDVVRNLSPDLYELVNSVGQQINANLGSLATSVSTAAMGALAGAASGAPGMLLNFVITIVASFFCVVDYYTITNFIARQLPARGRELLFKVKDSAVDVLFKFGRAYALLLTLTFVELLIGLSLLRIQYAFLLALVIALVDILPVLGTGTVLIPWAVATLILGNFPLGIGLLVLYAIITVVRQAMEPRVVGKQIGLHPLVTLISMFVGVSLFGFIGLFGLPIGITILVQMDREEGFKIFK